jgi:hypothetical protein
MDGTTTITITENILPHSTLGFMIMTGTTGMTVIMGVFMGMIQDSEEVGIL